MGVGELDERACLPVGRRERLLAVHVLARLERRVVTSAWTPCEVRLTIASTAPSASTSASDGYWTPPNRWTNSALSARSTSVAPAISIAGYAPIVSPYGPEMLPQPTTATRNAPFRIIRLLLLFQVRLERLAHPDAFGRWIAVVGLVLDGQRAVVAQREERVDAALDVDATCAVRARDVLAGALDVLQVDVEEALAEVADRTHGVVAVRREPAGVDRRAEHVRVVADQREHLRRIVLGMVLVAEADTVVAEDRGRAGEIRAQHVAHPAEQVDVQRRGEPTRGLQLRGGAPEVAGEAHHAQPVVVQRGTREPDVIGCRPAPVEVRHPEVERVEACARDRREHRAEALVERLERRERLVRRLVERPPVVGRAVAERGGDVVRAHERERERCNGGLGRRHRLPHVATKWSSSIG